MKNKKMIITIAVIIYILAIVTFVLFLAISYFYPYKYVENCFYSNKEDFEKLPAYFRTLQTNGISSVEVDENDLSNSSYNEVKLILTNLKEQYQKDDKYPVVSSVFSYVDAEYDENGNILLYMTVKEEKLRNGNGVDSPDIGCYYLVYIDENYSGNSKIDIDKNNREPFWGNWYTWSLNTYSG